ncbi:MAG: type IV pilus twitching motility protein PilT [Acidobacteriota bacterium]|nr:type IV pilus twitching motility protein PilT [Blastocatellia bacterium]MDW8412489.1 type IV pilus twitching motility protein PilT [Acidobacteriota bacterium]
MAAIDDFFRETKRVGASDLHMVVGRPPMLRLNGDLVPTKFPVLTQKSNREYVYEILTPAQREHLEKNLDLDFAYELAGVGRFRGNIFFQHRGLGAVFRLIPSKVSSLEQLRMPPLVKKLADSRSGLILVTGPTGSGKSTTLAAMIDYINETREEHILSIEDPIEFVHQNKRSLITQREIGAHTSSFHSALKVAGRQDPDILLVGEMRDLETISLALTLASFGILVFGTLHTNSAMKTVDRIIDVYPPEEQPQIRVMLAEVLRGVIAQQLLKTADGRGRIAAVEVLISSPALANMIREGKTNLIASYMQAGAAEGMQTMDMALIKLVQEQVVTLEAALEKAQDRAFVQSKFR